MVNSTQTQVNRQRGFHFADVYTKGMAAVAHGCKLVLPVVAFFVIAATPMVVFGLVVAHAGHRYATTGDILLLFPATLIAFALLVCTLAQSVCFGDPVTEHDSFLLSACAWCVSTLSALALSLYLVGGGSVITGIVAAIGSLLLGTFCKPTVEYCLTWLFKSRAH